LYHLLAEVSYLHGATIVAMIVSRKVTESLK
jgi:hypothetical protein